MRQLLVLGLVCSLSGSTALAQSLHEGSPAVGQPLRDLSPTIPGSLFTAPASAQPLQDSARRAVMNFAVQGSDDYMPGGMKPGYFWTAIGLWSAGALYLVSGALINSNDDYTDAYCDLYDIDCGGIGTAVLVLGSGLVGTGAVLWFLGKSKAAAAGNPSITFTPGGVALRGKFSF